MKFKWRISDRVPVSFQAAFLLFSLVIVLSVVSYQMLPETTWGENFSSLLLGVSTYVYTNPTNTTGATSLQNYATAEDFLQSPIAYNLSSHNEKIPINVENVTPKIESISDSDNLAAPPPHIIEDSWLPVSSDLSENISGTSENAITTSDARTVTAAPLPSLAPVSVAGATEKFLVPLLSFQVGAGNQFMEYLSAIVMARSLNRTLCLSPFFPGPSRHTGRVVSGLAWEDRYDVSLLSRFTRVAPLQQCLEQCDYTLNDKWVLKPSREPQMGKWKKYPWNNEGFNLKWDFVRWTAPEHIFRDLGSRDARCVGVVGLFPGLRWRGAFLAASAFVQFAPRINKLADTLQEIALGEGTRYLAVHWRFEETECNGHHVGLCFVRCDDGSVINSGLHPEALEWRKACAYKDGHFPGVLLNKNDIIDVIQERASNHSVTNIYLATDGWMRGPDSIALVKESVESLRKRGLAVVGLWKIPGLPNFADGKYFDPVTSFGKGNQDINGAQIALVEQELCSRAVSFLGSGPSTLSLAVFRTRLARRRIKQIVEAAELEGSAYVKESKAVDELIADTLLKDEHSAGLHCRYLRQMNRVRVNETKETYAEEYPDGWLDFEACEGRIGRGGRCEVAKCF
ncbi:hypothetical protein KC19_1G269400 [Ceratodon purpureus]|uniref:O-fucosyltransferase family protein n=1 Tax=Ceratodon purpureus TaxID=3225 RepID=A0A8T0JCS8_CERPU|nr:hypothetical protein KC19_1G269400 [Ceratodon purpureus]KAG0592641.1 hypothetical protein KC19_1G269400 [Ceratodon purpureus]